MIIEHRGIIRLLSIVSLLFVVGDAECTEASQVRARFPAKTRVRIQLFNFSKVSRQEKNSTHNDKGRSRRRRRRYASMPSHHSPNATY
jgi:hypothetical protein